MITHVILPCVVDDCTEWVESVMAYPSENEPVRITTKYHGLVLCNWWWIPVKHGNDSTLPVSSHPHLDAFQDQTNLEERCDTVDFESI